MQKGKTTCRDTSKKVSCLLHAIMLTVALCGFTTASISIADSETGSFTDANTEEIAGNNQSNDAGADSGGNIKDTEENSDGVEAESGSIEAVESVEAFGVFTVDTPESNPEPGFMPIMPSAGDEVFVSGPSQLAAAINGAQQNTSRTVRLLADIDYPQALYIENKDITFDLGGFTLRFKEGLGIFGGDVGYTGAGALEVYGASSVTGGGSFTFTYYESGDYAGLTIEEGTVVLNGDAKATESFEYGLISCRNYSSVTINGDVVSVSGGLGIYVYAYDEDSASVTVNGDVHIGSEYDYLGGGAITIHGYGDVSVYGDVYGLSNGIYATGSPHITIHGDLATEGQAIDAVCDGNRITVTGDVTAGGDGINAVGLDVIVGGNVTAAGTGLFLQGASVTIDGALEAGGNYIVILDHNWQSHYFAKGGKSPFSSKAGYDEYTYNGSFVWIKSDGSGVPAPVYTVTIPETLNLSPGDNLLPITVSDTANLGGKKVSVTLENTQQGSDIAGGFRLDNPLAGGTYQNYVLYSLYDAGDNIVPSVAASYGRVLADFDGDGAKFIRLTVTTETSQIMPGSPYTGYIVFGIKLQ